MCYAVGWGKTVDGDIFGAEALREARVPLIDDRDCRRAFDFELTASQMCAGYSEGGVDTCAGDSGGPLMCHTSGGGIDGKDGRRWYVHGVTSFGEGCGARNKFGIYTRVDAFVDWIDDVITKN